MIGPKSRSPKLGTRASQSEVFWARATRPPAHCNDTDLPHNVTELAIRDVGDREASVGARRALGRVPV